MMLSILKNRILVTSVASFLSFSSLGFAVQLEFCRDAIQKHTGSVPSQVQEKNRTSFPDRITLKAQENCCESLTISLASGDPFTNSAQKLQSSPIMPTVQAIGVPGSTQDAFVRSAFLAQQFGSHSPPPVHIVDINILTSNFLI